ncbi:hypothetical protein [Streptomyces calidiresistens]
MYRQGDVLLVPIGAGPADGEPPAAAAGLPVRPRDGRGRMVLALGEATGHAHAVLGPGELRGGARPEDASVLHLPEGGRLVHEEHRTLSLPRGWYRVIRQREYVPGAVRIVAD